MKRRVLLITLFAIILGLFSFQSAFAAGDIASGNRDGLDWRITSEGELIVGSEGNTQYLESSSPEWQSYADKIKTARFCGKVYGNRISWLFQGCKNLVSVDFTGLDTINANTMYYTFAGCSSLTSLDISRLNTSNMTDLDYTFNHCPALTSLDLSGCDFGKVTQAKRSLAGCSSLETIKTPKNLSIDIGLPVTMYDSSCREYDVLPKNLTSSITIYREPQHRWIEETKPATCIAEGYRKITCSNCGVIETTVIPKTSHSWDSGTVIKPAKYLSAGVKTYVCSTCGATKSQVIPAKNVKAVTPARVKLSGAKVSGKKLTVKWKRIAKNTKGYQVSVKDRKTGKEKYYAVKQSSKATLKKTIKKLKKGRKYAVRVRAYNQIGDEIIYGPWSNVKSGKI